MVRYMAEGKNGQLVRNNVVAAMWEDTKARVDNLGVGNTFNITCSIETHTHARTKYLL